MTRIVDGLHKSSQKRSRKILVSFKTISATDRNSFGLLLLKSFLSNHFFLVFGTTSETDLPKSRRPDQSKTTTVPNRASPNEPVWTKWDRAVDESLGNHFDHQNHRSDNWGFMTVDHLGGIQNNIIIIICNDYGIYSRSTLSVLWYGQYFIIHQYFKASLTRSKSFSQLMARLSGITVGITVGARQKIITNNPKWPNVTIFLPKSNILIAERNMLVK